MSAEILEAYAPTAIGGKIEVGSFCPASTVTAVPPLVWGYERGARADHTPGGPRRQPPLAAQEGCRHALERFLAAEAAGAGQPWIWIYHGPPDQAAVSWTGRQHQGDPFLDGLIGRHAPSIVISGHIHNSPFRSGGSWIDRIGDTWVLNPGRQLAEIPSIISLDLAAGHAE